MNRYQWLAPAVLGLVTASGAAPVLLRAQAPQPRFSTITTDDGLSHGSVTAILQDRDGFIWLGTRDGLNRFDGHRFVVFRHDLFDSTSLADNAIRDLLEDRAGRLWIATRSGLDRFDPTTGGFVHVGSNALSGGWVSVMLEDSAGRLWVGSERGLFSVGEAGEPELHVLDGDTATGALPGGVVALLEDTAGGLWIGTYRGLASYDPASGTSRWYVHDPEEPAGIGPGAVVDLALGPDGRIWIALHPGGVDALDPSSGRVEHLRHDPRDPQSLADDAVLTVTVDREGALWIGSLGGGLNRLAPATGRVTRYAHEAEDRHSLAANRVLEVFEDRTGILWIGTSEGASRLNRATLAFINYPFASSPGDLRPTPSVGAIAGDGAGALWVGTQERGLERLHLASGTRRTYGPDGAAAGLPHYRVDALLHDATGRVWVGTGGGLAALDARADTFVVFRHAPGDARSLSHDHVTALVPGTGGALWIGTWGGGLNRFDPATGHAISFRHDPDDASTLSSDFIRVVARAPTGPLWVGTENHGLNRFDPQTGEVRRFGVGDGTGALSDGRINALHLASSGMLWIGTEGGLNRLDPAAGVVRVYSARDGLPSDRVRGILSDDAGRLWIATGDGLARFDPDAETFATFDVSDGLLSAGFVPGSDRGDDGRLYFGTRVGVVAFDPDQVRTHDHAPAVAVTSLRVLRGDVQRHETLQTAGPIAFSYREAVSIQFAALDYWAPERNRYGYRLTRGGRMGGAGEWIPLAARDELTLAGLSPGRYTLELRGTNSHGAWSDARTALALTVTPPWWATWWARGTGLLLLAGVLTAGHKVRTRRIRARTDALQQEVAQREHAEARLRSVITNSPVILFALDPGGAVTLSEGKGLALLGMAPGDGVGRSVFELFARTPETIENVRRGLAGEARSWTARVGDVAFDTRVMPSRGPDGGLAGLIGVATDVSDRLRAEEESRRLESELRRTQRLEAIGQLAGGVAHDFNNLLTVIGTHAEFLAHGAAAESEELESAREIQHAQASAASLTRQLLAFGRQQVMRPVPLDVNEVVRGVETMLRRVIGEHIDLVLHLERRAACIVADPGQIEQIVVNLIVNARDALPDGGRITVTTRAREYAETTREPGLRLEAGAYVSLEVRDNGLGMPDGVRERIFEPFFTTKTRGRGTGLGLSTVFGIVKQSGGDIAVETAPGAGSRFRIFFPAASPADAPGVAGEVAETAQGGRETILVVEDDEAVRRVLIRILEHRGYRVLSAADGRAALEIARAEPQPIDLLVTDLVMPGLNGRVVAERLAGFRPETRILYVSGYAHDTIGADLMLDPSLNFLAKPFTPAEVGRRVRETLDRGMREVAGSHPVTTRSS